MNMVLRVWRCALVVLALSACEPQALAASEDKETASPTATVSVPGFAQDKGYSLRINGGEPQKIDGDKIVVKREEKRKRVDMIDESGRIVSTGRSYVDERLFERLSPRHWKLGMMVGAGAHKGDSTRGMLQDGSYSEFSLEASYQWGALGVAVGSADLYRDNLIESDVRSNYRVREQRLAATYEIAPFGRKQNWLNRMHLVGFAGVQHGDHKLEISDGLVSINARTQTLGPWGALEALFPVGNFWLGLRAYASYQEVRFKEIDYKARSVQQGVLLGGYYAF